MPSAPAPVRMRPYPAPLDTSRPLRILLQIDGGGIMGITPALVVREIETTLCHRRARLGKRLRDYLSVCSGTSTGAVIAGLVAAGVPAQAITEFYLRDGVELFQKSGVNHFPAFPICKYKFRRDLFRAALARALAQSPSGDPQISLRSLRPCPRLIIPAYDLVGRRTHFFTLPGDNENAKLIDVISYSAFSAPLYFGKIPAPDVTWTELQADGSMAGRKGSVFNDGGQGTQNSTMIETVLHALRYDDCQIVLISLGCGNNYAAADYEAASRESDFGQLKDYLLGNEARNEATLMQWLELRKLAAARRDFHIFRFDWNTAGESTDAFSINSAQLELYQRKAREIISRQDFRWLMGRLLVTPITT